MDLYLTPLWMLLNVAKATKLGVLIAPQEQKTIKRGQPFLMVNNRATYQRQSWIPEAPTGEQALFITAASNGNCPVPPIIEEHKLNFNLLIISLMFTWDPDNHTTSDIHHADRPNMHDINQGMRGALKVPITVISNANITRCKTVGWASRGIKFHMQHGGTY